MKRHLLAVIIALGACAASGCKPPRSAVYTSPRGDFRADVPWAWSVMLDADGRNFVNTAFIGPFEPDFYLGAPSLSVRWHAAYAAHKLRDGSIEMYAGPDDYIKQTLEGVYGPDRVLLEPVSDVVVAGRRAKHFVVLSAGPAHPKARWGTAVEQSTGRTINPRQHAYVVVPAAAGFYVLVYPATQAGFAKYEPQFNRLVNSFTPLTDGPDGAALAPPAGKKAR
ncbi:MAG: hypothetical protein PHF00_02560 [Elusimicrobia bacterium]|nr:hypothetical protein [Elusimicrobiota bacterium]